mgnify:CR=1 FL=1
MENRMSIVELVAQVLKIDSEEVLKFDDEKSLKEFGVTSLKAMELIVLIETKLGVELDDEDLELEKIDTIKELCVLYNKYKQ